MAHGENAQHQNKDWWGKRPLRWISVRKGGMKAWKKILHGIERAQGKRQINKDQE